MSYFYQDNFNGDVNVGLYGFATENFFVTGLNNKKIVKNMKDVLKVPVYSASFLDMPLAKLFSAGNSHGLLISSILPHYEIDEFKKKFDFKLKVLNSKYAIGNFILMNDKGIVISPELKNLKEDIEKFFSLDAKITKIAGLNIVGALGVANNKGCLIHPEASEKEADIIKSALDVEVNIGTVCFGNLYPGSGLIVNSNGFVTSKTTSGSELGRITETLGFL